MHKHTNTSYSEMMEVVSTKCLHLLLRMKFCQKSGLYKFHGVLKWTQSPCTLTGEHKHKHIKKKSNNSHPPADIWRNVSVPIPDIKWAKGSFQNILVVVSAQKTNTFETQGVLINVYSWSQFDKNKMLPTWIFHSIERNQQYPHLTNQDVISTVNNRSSMIQVFTNSSSNL